MSDKKNVLDEVFDRFLTGSTIFRNREALRHDYVPENLPHRTEHIRYLGEILAPALRGSLCSNALIYGKTGTGKTAVVRFVLNKVLDKSKEQGSSVRVCYVNCQLVGTEYRVFSLLCSALDIKVPFTGLALAEVFDRFKQGLDSKKFLFIVALDEIDAMVRNRGDGLLYELTRVNESLPNSKVSILGITNDLKFKDMLDPRVLSTLSEEEIVFRPYNADELWDILLDRAKVSFYENVLTEGTTKLCAALAAAEHGDARRALDLLRVAGELAERRGSKRILEEHVRQAQERIEHDRVLETLKSLPSYSKLVLLTVYFFSRFNIDRSVTGDIYNLYCELCEQLGLSPLTQRRVSGLINELDAIGLLNSRVISLGRYGRTKRISLGIPKRLIKDVFFDDERFRSLADYNPRYLASAREG